jgi:acetylornithine/N-succinyldiaminopimelate aminotransferase
MNKSDIIDLEQKYVLQTYKRPEFVITKGEGTWLYDSEGNKYLDAGSGIAVTALGHNNEAVTSAIQEAMSGPIHLSNLYHNEPMTLLARDLCESCFADRIFFCNSGTEAVEGALKFARKYAKVALEQEDKTEIVAFTGSFHGRSMGALSATSTEKYRTPFGPLVPGFSFAEYNNVEAINQAVTDKTCAVIVEPVQGEGGVTPAKPEFLKALRQRCDEVNALLIFDEIQCGLGRTGQLWGYQDYGVAPDIMTIAKPIAGGLPMGGVLVTQAVANVMQPGDHGSTFAGGPFVSHVARAVFAKVSDPDFLDEVIEKGQTLQQGLQNLAEASPLVTEVRGRGLIWGIVTTVPAADVVKAKQERGVLALSAGANVVRLLPPLTINANEINFLLDSLSSSLTAVAEQAG